MTPREECELMVEDCVRRESKLDELEGRFIDEMERLLRIGESLTHAQAQRLEALWDRVTGR